jgi:hypothetical protein
MAQKVQVMLVCDLHEDEVEGVETIAFGLDGSSYEIDACEEHAAELRDAFAGYVGAARRAGRPRGGSGPRRSAPRARLARRPRAATASGCRRSGEWARSNGHTSASAAGCPRP